MGRSGSRVRLAYIYILTVLDSFHTLVVVDTQHGKDLISFKAPQDQRNFQKVLLEHIWNAMAKLNVLRMSCIAIFANFRVRLHHGLVIYCVTSGREVS